MHSQQTHLLRLGLFLISFVVLEEAASSVDDLWLSNTPHFLKVVDDCCLVVEGLENLLIGNVLQSNGSITDARSLDKLDPAYLVCVVAVGSAAGFNVNIFDINHSDNVSWHNSALIQVKSMFFFSLLLALEIFTDGVTFKYDFIGLVFNSHLCLFAQRTEVSDVDMSFGLSLFGTMLPHMRTEYSAGSSIYDMSSCVERS